jgi:bifunctional enzyme CysN/CysC
MAHQSELIKSDIHAYLKSHEEKSLLRFITCGSVDDGKSTLIGRLLWDSKLVYEDQLAALEADSKKVGTQEGKIDYALLLDGLQAEREQGITIDVAYRYFSTNKRKFIVADTPGHEQYTRNMVTGASTAQVAVILIDARKGLLTQSRRHSYLASLVGIRQVVLAINKMDLVGFSRSRFEAIRKEYELFAGRLGFDEIAAIPISALNGDNVIDPSVHTPWHDGPTLLEYLERVEIADNEAEKPFRMRVQWVNRPNLDFRGFCGTIASGQIRPGDEIVVTASGKTSRVADIVTMDGNLPAAFAGQSVTLTLEDEIDISRGDLLSAPDALPNHGDRYRVKLAWLHEQGLQPGSTYLLKAGASTAPVKVEELQHKINVNTLLQETGSSLELNEVGSCVLNIAQAISFDAYRKNRSSGSFILIDRMTNATVGAGMVEELLESVQKNNEETHELNAKERDLLKGQDSKILWFIGSGQQGGSELVSLIEQKLHRLGLHTHLLNAEKLRLDLNRDLSETVEDRVEEQRRLLAVAKLCADAGLIVLFDSPFAVPAEEDTVGYDITPVIDGERNMDEQAESIARSFLSRL